MFDSPKSTVCRSDKMVTSATFANKGDLNLAVQQSIALSVGKCTCNVTLGNWAWVYPAHFAGLTQQKLLSG